MKFLSKIKGFMTKKKKDTKEKIVPPEELSQKEKEELENAMKELQTMFSGKIMSLEDFIKENSTARSVPFVVTKDYNDIVYEKETHRQSCEHWNDLDFVEYLLGYYNQGYDMDGLIPLYEKLNQQYELTAAERKRLEQLYMLVSCEVVYDV